MLEKLFTWIATRAWVVIAVGLLVVAAAASGLPSLYKDTSPDAYIEPENPALIYRDKVKEIFGLDDPFVVAIEAPEGKSIYTLETLTLVADLTDVVMETENIDFDRVVSLTTEKVIRGDEDEISIAAAFEYPPYDIEEVIEIRQQIEDFPLFHGNLVARDGSMTIIVGEMVDPDLSKDTFINLDDGVRAASEGFEGTIHVAGEAATAGYLDDYISQDTRRAFPLAAVFIIIVLSAAFRSISGVLLPFMIAIITAVVTIGIRATMDVPFYAVSNALLVVLISIAVADAIHIISEYRDEVASGEHETPRDALVAAMSAMFVPVALTSVTTVAGFIGIWFGSDMPPMRAFGQYAAVGVLAAWTYSITMLPAVLSLMHRNKNVNEVWAKGRAKNRKFLKLIMEKMAGVVVTYPKQSMTLSLGFLVICIFAAGLVEVDYSRIRNFAPDEDVRVADNAINKAMDGTYRLHVVVDGREPQSILTPEVTAKIEDLQEFALSLDGVAGVSSIVDTLKEVNKGLSGGDPEALVMPETADEIAQLFLAYESLGDPADLEDDIDFDQQLTLVKLRTKASSYKLAAPIVEALDEYLANEFNDEIAEGTLSGRVYLNYHWLESIDRNHMTSVAIAVALALMVAGLTFRSAVAAFFCLYHVVFAVFMVYAVMGILGIGLGVTTSMFAAITIGLGVDFSVHSIERVRMLATATGKVTPDTIRDAFQSTGRALWFNLWALCLGFSALMISNNPTIAEFSGLLIVAIAANFLASMTALPSALLVMKPSFLVDNEIDISRGPRLTGIPSGSFMWIAAAGLGAAMLFASPQAQAVEGMSADEIVAKVNERDEGENLTRDLRIVMIDRKGRERERFGKGYRTDTETERRSMIAFDAPANIKDTAFLTFDYHEVGEDDQQWLYLSASRKSRRVSGAHRGEYFLGTNLTFEDLKQEGRIGEEDYDFKISDEGTPEGMVTIEGTPKSVEIARELGYGRILVDVDPSNWMVAAYRIDDVKGRPLKTIEFQDRQQVGDIWTAGVIFADNYKTKNKTRFEFSNIDFESPIEPSKLEQQNLKRAGR